MSPRTKRPKISSGLIHRFIGRDRWALLIRMMLGRLNAAPIHPHEFAKDDRCCVYTILGCSPGAPLLKGSSIGMRCTLSQRDCYAYSYVKPAFGVVYQVQRDSSSLHCLASPPPNIATQAKNTFAAASLTPSDVINRFRWKLASFSVAEHDVEEWAPGVVQDGGQNFLARCRVEPEEISVDDIESLALAADRLDRRFRFFFSFAAPFSRDAVSTANANSVALFQIHLNGWVTAENAKAREVQNRAAALPPFGWQVYVIVIPAVLVYLAVLLGPWVVFGLAPLKTAHDASTIYLFAGILGTACFLYLFAVLTGRDFGRFGSHLPGLVKVTAALLGVVASFAAVYLQLNHSRPDSFNLPLKSHLDALYFTVTTLSTVGYGDPKPMSETCRAVVTGQLIATLAIVAVGLAILSSRLVSSALR